MLVFDLPSPTDAGKPSRVIHIRNIPNEASDAEVINLGLQFGRVTNVLVLKGKNQAFLEMADEISATAMVSVFNTTPPTVRGRTVYVQFSNHRELKTDQNHSITVSCQRRHQCHDGCHNNRKSIYLDASIGIAAAIGRQRSNIAAGVDATTKRHRRC